jgi:MFS family permease
LLQRLRSNPALLAVTAEAFLARLGFGVITFALPFFALSLGMSFTEIGILAALRLVTANVFKPLTAILVVKFGTRPLYIAAISMRTLVCVGLVFATAPWMLYALRFLHGLSTSMRDPTASIMIAERSKQNRTASAFAWYGTAREAGAALGYLVAGFGLTFTDDNYPALFAFAAVTSLLSLLLVWRTLPQEQIEKTPLASIEEKESSGKRNHWKHFAIWGGMVTTAAAMVATLFPLIASEYAGLSKAEISVIFTAATLTIIFGGPFFGWLSDTISHRLVLAVRTFANVLSSIIYVFAPNFAGMLSARLSDDIGKAAFRPAWGGLMADLTRSRSVAERRRIITHMDTAQSVGEAVGPVLAGLLWDHLGILWLFGVRLAIAVGSELYSWWIRSRHVAQPAHRD